MMHLSGSDRSTIIAMAAAAAGSNDKQQAAGSSSSSTIRGGDDAGSSSSSSRPSVAEAAAASQQHHQAALRERYELQSLRGKGSFAEVWEARHRRTGLKVAIKIISHARMLAQGLSSTQKEKKIAWEIRVMRLLCCHPHPHVIRFYDAMATHAHTYIVMELAEAGQLYDHVVLQGRLPEDQARTIFRQLAAAVLFCHRNMVAHRDLKMENVLLSRRMRSSSIVPDPDAVVAVKVVDFGFSKLYTDAKPMRKKMGSPQYAAPELLFGGATSRYVGPQVDVWSCGVILYAMLCGGLPFDGADVSEIARNVRRGEYRVPSWVSDDARDLIAGMLIVRPSKRMTMAEVMAHRWLHPADMPAYLLAMPPPPPPPDAGAASISTQVQVDEAAVEQLVTRHGFDRSSLLKSLHQQQQHQEDEDVVEAAVAYQLVLATMSDAPTRYLSSMIEHHKSVQEPEPQWALGGLLDGGGLLLHDCPSLTMQRIAAALEDLNITIVSYHTRRHRIKCCAHVPVPVPVPAGDPCILDSLSAAVFFEIQVYKTRATGELFQQGTAANGDGNNNNNSQQEQDEGEGRQRHGHGHGHPQSSYVVHLNRISGPQLPYLSICSQLSARLRRHLANNSI